MLQYCPEREKEANKIQEKEKKKLWPEKNSYLKEQQPVPVRTPPYKRSQLVLWERAWTTTTPFVGLFFQCDRLHDRWIVCYDEIVTVLVVFRQRSMKYICFLRSDKRNFLVLNEILLIGLLAIYQFINVTYILCDSWQKQSNKIHT